jgi:hypothetical protein
MAAAYMESVGRIDDAETYCGKAGPESQKTFEADSAGAWREFRTRTTGTHRATPR